MLLHRWSKIPESYEWESLDTSHDGTPNKTPFKTTSVVKRNKITGDIIHIKSTDDALMPLS